MRRVGQYELLRKIGAGGMAQVWMGRRAAMEGVTKVVAIKLLGSDHIDDPRYHEMFVNEARLTMLLSHSNVVQVFDAGRDGAQSYMVMEWVDGLNLAQLATLMRERGLPVPLPVAAFVIGEVLRALSYAHTVTHAGAALGVVHRDVSPQNVLISVSGEVKLADFGVARLAREETSGLHVKGKLRYMAPEQLEGKSKAPTVDLYAVGALLHELMNGRKFREAEDEMHLYGKVLSGEVPTLANDDVPRELDQLRLGLLAPDPAARIQSADQALELLMRWPGYRNTDRELAKLCRSFMGVKGPRSGIHERATPSHSAVTAVEATVTAANRSQSLSAQGLGSGAHDSGNEPTASELEMAATEAALVPAGAGTGGTGPRPAVVFGIAFAVAGLLGGGIAWWAINKRAEGEQGQVVSADAGLTNPADAAELVGGEPETTLGPPAEEPVEPVGEAEPADSVPEPESTGDLGGLGDADDDGVEPVPEPAADEPEPEPEPSKAEADPQPKKAGKARVELKTGDFRFVYVKLGGTSYTLEPLASAKLKAGKHKLYMRESPEDSWKFVKNVTLEPNASYVIRMKKPAGASVTKR